MIQVDPIKLEVAKTSLTGLYDLVCHAYTNNSITAKITKVKVDQIINDLLTYPNLDGHSVVSLHHTQSGEALQCVSQLRRAISILFSFVRRPSPNAVSQYFKVKSERTYIISFYPLRISTKTSRNGCAS